MYKNVKLKPITEAQLKHHKLNSAKFIFVKDKDGNAKCSRCDSEFNLGKTKHLSMVECPSCKKQMKIQHEWRMSKYAEVINWMVIPKALDKHTLVLRYVLYHYEWGEPVVLEERARLFVNEYEAKPEYWTYEYNYRTRKTEWQKGKGTYFRTPSYMTPNRLECLSAYEYPRNFFKEINKLECFTYYPVENIYSFQDYSTQLHYLVRSARVNEKMEKAGLDKLVDYHKTYYYWNRRTYNINNKKTKLIDMLKLNKTTFKLLKEKQTDEFLKFLQRNKNVKPEHLKLVNMDISIYKLVKDYTSTLNVSFEKLAKYLNGKNTWEWKHYIGLVRELGYDLKDSYYSMPKDFKKADERITKEYLDKQEAERRAKETEKDVLIKKISDGLKEMSNLKEFFGGSNGLLVYVPESAHELRDEGKALHNCIGTYTDRIAQGKTLVFYIRQLSDPTAPFVAMEYCNGSIIQCRYDRNESVYNRNDELSNNIINFAEAFANALKESKVLAA